MMQFLFYTFDSGIDGEPGATRLQVNAAFPYSAASRIYVHKNTDGGADARYVWLSVEPGATIYLQDKNDSTIAHRFTVMQFVVDRGYYLEVPIRWESGQGGALNANQDIAVGLQEPAPIVTTPPIPAEPGGPLTYSRVTLAFPLWSVAEAKRHARISDAAHDDDVAQKLAAAQEMVLAFLGPAGDPTWTPATAPEMVKHAVLMLAVHYYEHRGDDIGGDRDEAVIWRELRNGLGFHRDVGVG